MSRTYKDAPVYVKLRREKTHIKWEHNEFLIGLNMGKHLPMLDECGNYITVTYTEPCTIWGEYYSGEIVYEYSYTKQQTYFAYVTEKKILKSFKNYCTCGVEPVRTTSKLNQNPCRKRLTPAVQKDYYGKQYKQINHEGGRKETKKTLHVSKKVYNSNKNVDSLDDDFLQTVYIKKSPLEWVH